MKLFVVVCISLDSLLSVQTMEYLSNDLEEELFVPNFHTSLIRFAVSKEITSRTRR
jgi:hypothetical protein